MPKYDFNFSLDVWVKSLEIEADSLEEAKEKLNKMTVEELIEEGYVKYFDIKDLDCSVEDNEEE